jgi:hypothetical protein
VLIFLENIYNEYSNEMNRKKKQGFYDI